MGRACESHQNLPRPTPKGAYEQNQVNTQEFFRKDAKPQSKDRKRFVEIALETRTTPYCPHLRLCGLALLRGSPSGNDLALGTRAAAAILAGMAASKPTLCWFQYSLRTLLVVLALCAIPCSWLASSMQQARREREAVAAIEKLGGSVQWSEQSRIGRVNQNSGSTRAQRAAGNTKGDITDIDNSAHSESTSDGPFSGLSERSLRRGKEVRLFPPALHGCCGSRTSPAIVV